MISPGKAIVIRNQRKQRWENTHLNNVLCERNKEIAALRTERERMRWGLQWMLNNLTGIDHEWAKEACNIARQSLNPQPKS